MFSRSVWLTTKRLPRSDFPRRYHRTSPTECAGSGTVMEFQSANAVDASSKVTPCFFAFVEAFFGSHSKFKVTILRDRAVRGSTGSHRRAEANGVVRHRSSSRYGTENSGNWMRALAGPAHRARSERVKSSRSVDEVVGLTRVPLDTSNASEQRVSAHLTRVLRGTAPWPGRASATSARCAELHGRTRTRQASSCA